jgi:hypothetical protein
MRPENDARGVISTLASIDRMLDWPSGRLYVVVEHVSTWSPAQHVEHALLGLDHVLDAMARIEAGEDGVEPEGAPRLAGRAVLLTGRLPRGRAQAPAALVPAAAPARAGLRERFLHVRRGLNARAARAGRIRRMPGTLPHPFLGHLNAAQWLRFARVHTDHHLAIVDDIDRIGVRSEPCIDPLAPLGEAL